jgi:hypothetical protein
MQLNHARAGQSAGRALTDRSFCGSTDPTRFTQYSNNNNNNNNDSEYTHDNAHSGAPLGATG